MYSKTQMMNIERLELFYLFRRAFGFFFLFAFVELFNGQITVIGNVEIIEYTYTASIQISGGASIFEDDSVNKIQNKKRVKKKIIRASKPITKVRNDAIIIYKTENISKYKWHKTDCSKNYLFDNITKILFSNTNNHNQNFSHAEGSWKIDHLFWISKSIKDFLVVSNSSKHKMSSNLVRPPPHYFIL